MTARRELHPPRSVRITGWGNYVPTGVLTNHDLEGLVDTNDEWIVTRTGIRERRVAGPYETTASMAAIAGARAIAVAGIDPADVDLLLVATLTPDYLMPSTASLVKEAIGTTRAAAMDVAAACSGFVFALSTARAHIASGMAKHVVVIGSELLTRFIDYTDRGTCILFGDGAGAVVLSASEEAGGGIIGQELTTDPTGAYMIWLPGGGSALPASDRSLAGHEHLIRMDGKETYRFATRTLISTTKAALADAGITAADVAVVVPHQANLRIIETVVKGLDYPMERVFVNIDRYGNTSAASVPIALTEAVEAGRIKPGDNVVFAAFGAGFTSGAIVVEWTADPAAGERAAAVDPSKLEIRPPVGIERRDTLPPVLAKVLAGHASK